MMFVAALAGVALAAAPPVPDDELDRCLDLLDRIDRVSVSVDRNQSQLGELIDALDEQTDVPIRADWESLRRLGVRDYDEVELRLDRGPLSRVLAGVMLQLGDEFGRPTYEAFGGEIIITTKEATADMALTDIYDVRDLLADGHTLDELRDSAPPIPTFEDEPHDVDAGEGDDGASGDPEADSPDETTSPSSPLALPEVEADRSPRQRTPGQELMILITEHVDPTAWLTAGGLTSRIDDRNGVVLVTAPSSTHRMFRDALRRLRLANPSMLRLEAAIADVPTQLLNRTVRRGDRDDAAAIRSLLEDPASTLVWRSASTVAIGETMAAESQRDATRVTISVTSHFDRTTGRLSLDVDASLLVPDDERSIHTTVVIPLRRGGVLLELAPTEPGERTRVLILLPERA
jgi:hypothetical protein